MHGKLHATGFKEILIFVRMNGRSVWKQKKNVTHGLTEVRYVCSAVLSLVWCDDL
jgi:hypothetical protein